jgi:hypothetical protein
MSVPTLELLLLAIGAGAGCAAGGRFAGGRGHFGQLRGVAVDAPVLRQ